MDEKTVVQSVQQNLPVKKKKRKNKKKSKPSSSQNTNPQTTQPTQSDTNETPKPPTLSEKLHNRLGAMKSRRTGVERRKREEAMKAQGEKPKNSNAMRSIARGEISELLSKMGINDPKLESEVMNEIMRGNLRTPAAIAEYLVQKLQLSYPRGMPKKNSSTETKTSEKMEVKSETKSENDSAIKPEHNSENKSENKSDNEPEKTVHGHKPLKHPSPSLVLKSE
jgi:hypothetical protein